MCHMKSLKRVAALGLVLALGAGQEAWAAQQQEEDSVYRWGRWAVLSPAAGGDSYEGSETPDAANNARPGEASEFQPVVASVGTPPVGTEPGVAPVDPGQPIVNLPPPPPPPVSSTPGVVPVDPGQPIVNLPSPPPPL